MKRSFTSLLTPVVFYRRLAFLSPLSIIMINTNRTAVSLSSLCCFERMMIHVVYPQKSECHISSTDGKLLLFVASHLQLSELTIAIGLDYQTLSWLCLVFSSCAAERCTTRPHNVFIIFHAPANYASIIVFSITNCLVQPTEKNTKH